MSENSATVRPDAPEQSRHRAAAVALSLLVPAQFDIEQKIVEAITTVLENVLEGLVGFVQNVMNAGIETFMFFPPPSGDPALESLWRKSLGVFFGLLLLGWLLYLLVMQLFPNTKRTDPYRMAERTLAGVVMVIVSRQAIVFAVQLTNAVGRYMYPEDVLTATLGGDILNVGGSIAAIVVAYVLGAGLVVSILSFVFVLGVRMVLVYMVYALFPLITALWIFDVGPGKYTKSLADTTFRTTTYLLVAGVLIAAILAAGGAVANAVDDTDATDGNASALDRPASAAALSGVEPAASEPSGATGSASGGPSPGSDTHLGPPPDGSTREPSLAAQQGEHPAVAQANESSGESSASSTFGAGTIAKVFTLAVTFGLASVALGYLGFSASLSGLTGLVSGGGGGGSSDKSGSGGSTAGEGSSTSGQSSVSDGGRPPTNPSAAAAAGVGTTSDRRDGPGEQTTLDSYDAGGMTNPPAAGASDPSGFGRVKRGASDVRSGVTAAGTSVVDPSETTSKWAQGAKYAVGGVAGAGTLAATGNPALAVSAAALGKTIGEDGVKAAAGATTWAHEGGVEGVKQMAGGATQFTVQKVGGLVGRSSDTDSEFGGNGETTGQYSTETEASDDANEILEETVNDD